MSVAATTTHPLSLVVLISGRGSNLGAIIERIEDGELPARIVAVVSNRPAAAGLELARTAGIETRVVDHTAFSGRDAFDSELMACIDAFRPDYVVMAGFMRILTDAFIDHYRYRMLNIHPSLLPAYRGLDTHARVLAAGERWHGASVHFVTGELDGGPVLLQARVPVLAGDEVERLAARVLEQEHYIYPLALRWLAQGRVRFDAGGLWFDDAPLQHPLRLEALTL